MGDNIENRQSTSSGGSSREVSGLQDLLTPFYTPQEGGGRRSGVYKRRILHDIDHNAEVPPRKRAKGSGTNKVKETREAALVDFSRGGDNAFDPKFSKTVSTALEPYIRYMLRNWADFSSKHPGMAKSSFPLKWLGNIDGRCEQSEVSIGDLAGKADFNKETGGRKGVRRKKVEGNTGRRCYTDWAQVAAAESRKKQLAAVSVERKSVRRIDAGGIDSVGRSLILRPTPVEAGASSSLESEYSNRTNLDTTFIGAADSNVEEEVVNGFLFQASKTMFPLEEVVQNHLAEKEAQELHNLEVRFGIEVLSFKEAKRVVSWWESRRALHLKRQ